MRTLFSAFVTALLTASIAFAGRVDREVVQVAQWMVGSFDNRAQAEADRAAGTSYKHDVALMTIRAIEDPVAFEDGLYLYVETRLDGQAQPDRQRVYRLGKSGSRIRLEVFTIDESVRVLLAVTPQMLSQLSPSDITRENGCDVLLEREGEEYAGAIPSGSCKSASKGTAYVTSSLRITKEAIVTLDRGYDAKGVLTFGPTDGRGYEFRRSPHRSRSREGLAARGESLPAFEREASPKGDERCIPPGLLRSRPEYSPIFGPFGSSPAGRLARGPRPGFALSVLRRTFTTDC